MSVEEGGGCLDHSSGISIYLMLKKQYNYKSVCIQIKKKALWFPFGLVLWHINRCRLFNAKSIFIHINSSISNNSVQHKYSILFTLS